MDIPFVDLKTQYQSIKAEIDTAIQEVISKTAFTLGGYVQRFEENFAEYCEVKHCVGVSSGTDALHLALLACGVGQGDEVIISVNTFIATAEAVSHCGAVPVFVDIDEKTYNIDVTKIEEKITRKTKAIIPVHLYGQPADMEAILEIAKRHNLKVVEDACQAHGAVVRPRSTVDGPQKGGKGNSPWSIVDSPQRVGGIGHVGCFSFYPGKNLGAYGDGGAIVTNNPEIDKKIRLLRNHGEESKYVHSIVGYCSRLHSIQAAILDVKLKKLDEWNQKRRDNALLYSQLLKDSDLVTPYIKDNVESVYHLYVIRVKDRDKLRDFLGSKGIATGIHYPVPIHLELAYKSLGYKQGDFPVAEKLAGEILSLPMYAELSGEEIEYVVRQIANS